MNVDIVTKHVSVQRKHWKKHNWPHKEHFFDLQLEIHQPSHMMSHIMTAQTPMTRDKPLFGTVIQYYLEVGALHLTFRSAALGNQDASAKIRAWWINMANCKILLVRYFLLYTLYIIRGAFTFLMLFFNYLAKCKTCAAKLPSTKLLFSFYLFLFFCI